MKLYTCAKMLSAGAVVVVLLIIAGRSQSAAMNESTAHVKHIQPGDFAAEVTQSTNGVVADFYAIACAPCRRLSPLLDRLAGTYGDKIKFVKINVAEAPGIAQSFQVQGTPTVIFFRDGKVADRIPGLTTEAYLKTRLDAFAAGK